MHHADLYRNLHRIHGNMVLSLLWGQLSSKTIPHVSSSAVFIHHSSDSRHAVLFRLSDFCGISSFPELAQPVRKLMETAGLDSDIGLFMFIYAVILGPVCEELVFRGVTMRLVRRALPFWAANLMQAVLFGIFHMNWIQEFMHLFSVLYWDGSVKKEEASISQCSSTSCSTSGNHHRTAIEQSQRNGSSGNYHLSLYNCFSRFGLFLIPPGHEMARSESGAPYGCP